jgi:hypothetical protein
MYRSGEAEQQNHKVTESLHRKAPLPKPPWRV